MIERRLGLVMPVIVLGTALIITGACGDSPIEGIDPQLFEVVPTYREHIRPMFFDRCVGCHDSKGVKGGGVELDTFAGAYGTRVRNACVSLSNNLLRYFDDALRPLSSDPLTTGKSCSNWEPLSMPPAAALRLTPAQQVILGRWVETGGAR